MWEGDRLSSEVWDSVYEDGYRCLVVKVGDSAGVDRLEIRPLPEVGGRGASQMGHHERTEPRGGSRTLQHSRLKMSSTRRGSFCGINLPQLWPPSSQSLGSQTFPFLFSASQTVSHCTSMLKVSFSKSNNSSSSSPTARWGCSGLLSSLVQNGEDRAEVGHATGRLSQLEAVAMGFLSCWLRISRVRDSRSRSWQALHTNTGSYSCWSGMGSFRWQQSLQNTFPQFLREESTRRIKKCLEEKERRGNTAVRSKFIH